MKHCTFALSLMLASTSVAHADITGAYFVSRYVVAADGLGAPDFDGWVVDLFFLSDDPTDTDLNVFSLTLSNSAGESAYYQSVTGAGWTPINLGDPFKTDALNYADSFVSMGGRDAAGNSAYDPDGVVVQMAPNGTLLDPNFGGNAALAPHDNSGWYNSNPPIAIGRPVDGIVFIGRFSLETADEFALEGIVSTTWNNGIGTAPKWAFDLPIQPWAGRADCNQNGIIDTEDIAAGTASDCNGNLVPDECEFASGAARDCNENGVPDSCDLAAGAKDNDGNGIPDECFDCNENGIDDTQDIANGTSEDCDSNGQPDECEHPMGLFLATGDALPTMTEPLNLQCHTNDVAIFDPIVSVDVQGDFGSIAEFLIISLNGVTVGYMLDADGGDCTNASASLEIMAETWNDALLLGVPIVSISTSAAVDPNECSGSFIDVRVTVPMHFQDCNNNGVWDACDIADGTASDCNANGQPDWCGISEGLEEDCDGSGIPDDCEIDETTDCNANERLDSCDIAEGVSEDCNGNLIPDSCDLASGKDDENNNGIPDSCDLAWGDLDLDGCITGGDLGVLFSLWGIPDPPIGDLNGDGVLGGADLGILLDHWGDCL